MQAASTCGTSGRTGGRCLCGIARPAAVIGALCLAATQAQAADPSLGAPAVKWQPWVELGGYWSSDDASRGEAAFWLPLMQGPVALFFADVRGKLFEEDVSEGNFALGYRQMLGNGWNLGLWSGLDVRSTDAGNTFWQLSGGFEALTADWDLRVNGYVPLSEPEGSPSLAEVQLAGNRIFMIGGEEVPLYGVDGEVGYRLFGTPEAAPGRRHELRIYGGGFWYDHSDALQEIAGPKARAEWRIDNVVEAWPGSRLTIEGEFSHDDVRDDRWEIGARLRFPFGGGSEARTAALAFTPQERRMAEGLERDTDIVTAQSKAEPVQDALTNVDFDQVAFAQDGGSITNTSVNAGGDTLIIANGAINGLQELQGNQTLQGGGSTIQVRGLKSGTVAGFTAPGSRPTLIQTVGIDNLGLLASNTHIAGLDIEGAGPGNLGNDGIDGNNGLNNIFIEQTSISNVGNEGIFFLDDNAITILNTTIADAGSDGILIGDNNTVKISGVRIINAGDDGIRAGDANSLSISNSSITNVANTGIDFGDQNRVTLAGLSIAGTGDNGIQFNVGNDVTITDTSIAGVASDGLSFVDDNRVTIAGTSVSDVTVFGVVFNDGNTVTISDTALAQLDSDAIRFNEDNTVSMTGTTITESGGIVFFNNNVVDIADGAFANLNNDAIFALTQNTITITDTVIADVNGIGLTFVANNNVNLANSTLAGNFTVDGIQIGGGGNTLAGADNVAANATFAGAFCNAAGGQTGQFVFDIGSCPP